jgi:hypothetical protein
MNNLLKICKVCKVEQQRHGDFSGRSAICCKCTYAKKKDYFKKYYESNGEKMKQYEKVKYEKENPLGVKRSYKKKQPENKLILV